MFRVVFPFLVAISLGVAAAPPPTEAMSSLLLIAREELPDPNFRDAVVLVAGGAPAPIGVILNKPTDSPLSKALKNSERLKGADAQLFFGGPVQPQEAVFVFRASRAPDDAIAVGEGIYMSANRELLDKLLARERPLEELRIYAGHAGWAPGQLEREIARGDWFLVPTDVHAIFDAKPETMWPALIRKAMATKIRYRETQQ